MQQHHGMACPTATSTGWLAPATCRGPVFPACNLLRAPRSTRGGTRKIHANPTRREGALVPSAAVRSLSLSPPYLAFFFFPAQLCFRISFFPACSPPWEMATVATACSGDLGSWEVKAPVLRVLLLYSAIGCRREWKAKHRGNDAFGASCPCPPFTRANVQIL
jgi:hypothetical protein